ncbi:hypothetical protein FACS189491_00150 [Spirochaetia bacterium]|nr:hypothetical protein FACS189491_00150 [Spirochaetia bacterium]
MRIRRLFLVLAGILYTTTAALAQNNALPSLAVLEFSVEDGAGVKTKRDARTIRNQIYSEIMKTSRYRVIALSEIESLFAIKQIQQREFSSDTDFEKFELSQFKYLVMGEVLDSDDYYSITISIIDGSNGEDRGSDYKLVRAKQPDLNQDVSTLAMSFLGRLATEDNKVRQGDGSGLYKIGSRGPGGGFVFYSNRGTYMECSPNLGSFNWYEAINVAKNYRGGNFTDWHLPSEEELNLIYENLKEQSLGGSFEEYYWSSTESGNEATIQRFISGRLGDSRKSNSYAVRAVRAF